jgi:hypothetical protein
MAKKPRTPVSPIQPFPHAGKRGTASAGAVRSLLVLGVTAAAVLAAALGISWLRGDGEATRSVPPGLLAPPDPGPVHIHALGENPKDQAVFIATHTGLYRLADGATRAERVTRRRQDTMGFTVVGRDRFLGSGHPDVQEAREKNLPPLLGLIESRDSGVTWRPISLLGEADFHVLRDVRNRIYGFDSTNSRLMVSRDRGQTWRQRYPPRPLLDLVVDPNDPTRLLATSEQGLLLSVDEGRTWVQVSRRTGFLAWPARKRLYLIEPDGQVLRTADIGRAGRAVGDLGGPPSAFLARTSTDLYAALHDGTLKRSGNGGVSWSVRLAAS